MRRSHMFLIAAAGGALMFAGSANAQIGPLAAGPGAVSGTVGGQTGVRTDQDDTKTMTTTTEGMRDTDRDDRRLHASRVRRHHRHHHGARNAGEESRNASARVGDRDQDMRGDRDDGSIGARDRDANGDLHSTIRGPTTDPDANVDMRSGAGSMNGSAGGAVGAGTRRGH